MFEREKTTAKDDAKDEEAIKLRLQLDLYKAMKIFTLYTLFMCQVEISIRDSNFDPGLKFRSETQILIRNEIEISFRNPNFDSGPKFRSGTQISIRNPIFGPKPKFCSEIENLMWFL